MSKGKKLANTNILVMAQKENSLFDFLYTEFSQDKFESTIKELSIEQEMMVKLKTQIESYPKSLEGIYKFNAQFPSTLGRIFDTKEKNDLLMLGQRLVAAHHGTKEYQEMMADEISDLNHVFKEWFIGFANCKSKLKDRLKEIRNFNHYYNKIPRLKQEQSLKEATGQAASKGQHKIERNERKFKEVGAKLKAIHKECYEMMTQIIKNRYVLINPALLRFIGALRRFYSGVASIFVVFVEEKYEKGEFTAPPPERKYNASVLHPYKKKIKKGKKGSEPENPDIDLNLNASTVGGFKFAGFGRSATTVHDQPKGKPEPYIPASMPNPDGFQEKIKEIENNELSMSKKPARPPKSQPKAAAAGGVTKAQPAASIASLAHQKQKPSADYDIDLGEINEKEGNIYAAAAAAKQPAPTSFNFDFQVTSSGFPQKKSEEKTQNFKSALLPPPKPLAPKIEEKTKHPVAENKPSVIKQMFAKQKTKKEQKKQETKQTKKLSQKTSPPEPQIVFEDEQPQSNLPPHFRVLQQQQKDTQRRKEELAAKNPALARFGDPSLFEQTPPPRQDNFDNFDFGSQMHQPEEPKDKYSAEKKQDSFGELNALRFGGRFQSLKTHKTPKTYEDNTGYRAGSIEMGMMNQQQPDPLSNPHDDLIARRFGGALVEEEQKIPSYQEPPPPAYDYDQYPMAPEAEENRFEEGFSNTMAPQDVQWNYDEQDYNSEVSAPPDSDDSDDTIELEEPAPVGGHLARFGGILNDPRFNEEEEVKAYKSNEAQKNDWRDNYMQDISLKDQYNMYYTHTKPNQEQRPPSQAQRPKPQPQKHPHQPPNSQFQAQRQQQQQARPFFSGPPPENGKKHPQTGMTRPTQAHGMTRPTQAPSQIKQQTAPYNLPAEPKVDLNSSNPSQGSGDQRPRPASQLQTAAQKLRMPPPQANIRPYNPNAYKMQGPPTQLQPQITQHSHAAHHKPHPGHVQHPGHQMSSQHLAPGKAYLEPQAGMSRNPGHSHQKSMPAPPTLSQNPYSRQVATPQQSKPLEVPSQKAPSHYSDSRVAAGGASQKSGHDPFDFGIDLSVKKADRTQSIHKNNPFM